MLEKLKEKLNAEAVHLRGLMAKELTASQLGYAQQRWRGSADMFATAVEALGFPASTARTLQQEALIAVNLPSWW